MAENRRMLQFIFGCSPYHAGERASFGPAEAAKLVKAGVAVYVDVAPKAEEPVKVEDVNEETKDEQPTGTENEQGDDGDESDDEDGSGSDESEGNGDGEAAAGEERRKRKRVRVSE